MNIYTKIKCFFGFCKNLKLEQKQTLERVDVKVGPLEIKEEFGNKVNEALSITKPKPVKVKRHWYNNSKTQKLVAEGEETSLPKIWKKGRLKNNDTKKDR